MDEVGTEAVPVEDGGEIDLWTDEMAEAEVLAPTVDADDAILDDIDAEILAASKANLVDSVKTRLLDSGKCEATVSLNTAYAGVGRTSWTVYAIPGDATTPVKETFEDTGIGMSTSYTMKAAFNPGEAVLFGA